VQLFAEDLDAANRLPELDDHATFAGVVDVVEDGRGDVARVQVVERGVGAEERPRRDLFGRHVRAVAADVDRRSAGRGAGPEEGRHAEAALTAELGATPHQVAG